MAEEFLKEKIEMIAEGLEYMDKVIIQVEDVCENLRKKEGIEVIGQISEGFMAILQIAKYTQSVTEIEFDENIITEFVTDIVDGMENSDFNLVADIIEYEIKPLYEEWGDAFANAIENYENA